MKALLLGLLIGLGVGYWWGYGEATDKKPHIAARVLDRFGASKVRSASDRRAAERDEVSKP